MREIININNGWKFIKSDINPKMAQTIQGEMLNLPHTWNGKDGQDGGNNYFRGTCWYVRELQKPETDKDKVVYIEFKGVNSSAEVYVNGTFVMRHDGGYSTFRADITKYLKEQNIIAVSVDNGKTRKVYPQTADFTFYGGIYRDVNIIVVSKNHFDLDFYGSNGIKATPMLAGTTGRAEVQAFVKGKGKVKFTIFNAEGKEEATDIADTPLNEALILTINNVRPWDGIKDPYLYTLEAQLLVNGIAEDKVVINIGFRNFSVNPDEGFFLNGRKCPLRGVCRHQDRPEIGNALLKIHHEEDIKLISEVGANTLRLAHYQHDDYFYDLCDKYGIVVWAEIPYISRHMEEADENAVQQMKELIYQQYHHPSIVTWGLSNEITMHPAGKDMLDFHIKLNNLCHEIDSTRLTAIACYMPCRISHKLNRIPDIVSYNLYFGWYLPFTALAGWKLDSYHKKYPNEIIGLAEYGAEAMPNLHSSRPVRGDNTEEYQAIFHEKMLKIIEKRNYLWATHLWNMFDFAADARNQGGEPGMNHKGLITFDRKTKKDSFYLYKAYWSSQPFVHICGKRFLKRTGKYTDIKVYSNCNMVALYNNGTLISQKEGSKVFEFKILLQDINNIKASSGDFTDEAKIIRVDKKEKSYKLKKTKNKSWQK